MTAITEEIKRAAGDGLAAAVARNELGPEYVSASVSSRDVEPAVAAVVAQAAAASRVARRHLG